MQHTADVDSIKKVYHILPIRCTAHVCHVEKPIEHKCSRPARAPISTPIKPNPCNATQHNNTSSYS